MPLTRAAQQAQEADTVRSRPNRAGYHAPTKRHVLDHLSTVQLKLTDPRLTPEKRAVLVDDRDALLDRLSYWLAVEDEAS